MARDMTMHMRKSHFQPHVLVVTSFTCHFQAHVIVVTT